MPPGRILFHRITEAVEAEREHCTALKELQESVASSELGRTSLAIWEKEITTWENDHTQQNPFESQCNGMRDWCSIIHFYLHDRQR